MLVFPTMTLSSLGSSGIIQPYSPNNSVLVGQLNALPISTLGLICTVSSTASLTYSVQVTGDSNPSANGNWNNHDTLVAQTSSANGNIAYPVSAVRLTVTAYSTGSVSLGVVQWP